VSGSIRPVQFDDELLKVESFCLKVSHASRELARVRSQNEVDISDYMIGLQNQPDLVGYPSDIYSNPVTFFGDKIDPFPIMLGAAHNVYNKFPQINGVNRDWALRSSELGGLNICYQALLHGMKIQQEISRMKN